MKRAALTLLLLAAMAKAAPARAEEPTLGKRVDATKDAVTQAAQSAQERASAAAESAKERASEVADQAKESASAAADSLGERARDVATHAQELAAAMLESAKARAEQLGDHAGDALEKGKSAAGDAMQSARDQARAVLIGAAVALDNKSKDARNAARKASWAKLKERFSLLGNRPSMAMSEELRDHEYRVARLQRASELSGAVHDEAGVRRSGLLLEQEYGRHKRRVEELRKQELAESRR
jgi:hypothetical protein